MKKVKKIIIFLVMILMAFTINCYATSCTEIEQQANSFRQKGEEQINQTNGGDIATTIAGDVLPIYRMLVVAGVLIIGICFVILGIQWVLAKASPDAQSKLKTRMVALAIAAGVLFGSYEIWKLVVTILDSIDG